MKVQVLRSSTVYFAGKLQPKNAVLEVDDRVGKVWVERGVAKAVGNSTEQKSLGPSETKPSSPVENTGVTPKEKKPEGPKETGEVNPLEEKSESFPKHVGGGWFLLSNGEKVQGKEEAIEAQKQLDAE